MPYFICPNCKQRSLDHDGREGLLNHAVACQRCGFGFLFELMDDYYPAPGAGFLVTDQSRRVIAAGRGVFELTGYQEGDVLGRDLVRRARDDHHGEDAEGDLGTAGEAGGRQAHRAPREPAFARVEGLLPDLLRVAL